MRASKGCVETRLSNVPLDNTRIEFSMNRMCLIPLPFANLQLTIYYHLPLTE